MDIVVLRSVSLILEMQVDLNLDLNLDLRSSSPAFVGLLCGSTGVKVSSSLDCVSNTAQFLSGCFVLEVNQFLSGADVGLGPKWTGMSCLDLLTHSYHVRDGLRCHQTPPVQPRVSYPGGFTTIHTFIHETRTRWTTSDDSF